MARSNTVCFVSIAILTLMVGCGSTPSEEVIVYTSVDDVFARPVAEQFEQETGIVVRLVPDTEETKKHRVGQSLDCRERASTSGRLLER